MGSATAAGGGRFRRRATGGLGTARDGEQPVGGHIEGDIACKYSSMP